MATKDRIKWLKLKIVRCHDDILYIHRAENGQRQNPRIAMNCGTPLFLQAGVLGTYEIHLKTFLWHRYITNIFSKSKWLLAATFSVQ